MRTLLEFSIAKDTVLWADLPGTVLQEGVAPFPQAAVAVPLLFGISVACILQPFLKQFLILPQN